MDNQAIELVKDHLDFVKWIVGGAGVALAGGATFFFYQVVIPCRDCWIASQNNQGTALTALAQGIDSVRKHIKDLIAKPNIECQYLPDADTHILPSLRTKSIL